MKQILFLLIILFVSSCSDDSGIVPSGNVVEEIRSVAGFSELEVANGISVDLLQAESGTVTVEADDNIIQYVETYAEGKMLFVKIEDGIDIQSSAREKTVKVTVPVRILESMSASGGSDINFSTSFMLDNLDITASGGPDISGELYVDSLSLNISGGGNARLKGNGDKLNINVSGGSNLYFYDMIANNVDIEMTGGSVAELYVNNILNIYASGGSKVYYKGSGQINRQILEGGSTVYRQN